MTNHFSIERLRRQAWDPGVIDIETSADDRQHASSSYRFMVTEHVTRQTSIAILGHSISILLNEACGTVNSSFRVGSVRIVWTDCRRLT
jgi:hypothetical protein